MSKYSIILPVFNGGAYVKDCVASILGQTWPHFNLIVLDNASTDGTTEWLQSLQDDRIVLVRSDKKLTIEENWGRAVGVPKNEFVTLIGHDDVLDSHYLATMEQLIAQHPQATLYQTHFRYIDPKGNTIRPCRPMAATIKADAFLALALQQAIDIMGTGFMMRSKDYEAVGGIPPYPNLLFADFELWMNLIGTSYMAVSPTPAFGFRLHNSTTSTSSDKALQHAFALFIDYLGQLQTKQPEMKAVVAQNLPAFLHKYCQSFAHRLLRTPLPQRKGHTVKQVIDTFAGYGARLLPSGSYRPLDNGKVRLAKLIDSNAVARWLFLLFKKIYRQPVYD
jgi:hypothetical protein